MSLNLVPTLVGLYTACVCLYECINKNLFGWHVIIVAGCCCCFVVVAECVIAAYVSIKYNNKTQNNSIIKHN